MSRAHIHDIKDLQQHSFGHSYPLRKSLLAYLTGQELMIQGSSTQKASVRKTYARTLTELGFVLCDTLTHANSAKPVSDTN